MDIFKGKIGLQYSDILLLFICFVMFFGFFAVVSVSAFGSSFLLGYKDFSLIFMLILGIALNAPRCNKYLLYVFAVLSVLAIYAFGISYQNTFLKIASLRQFICPFLIILVGYLFVNKREDYNKLTKSYLLIIFLILVFGYFERFFMIWRYVDVSPYFSEKRIPVFSNGYPVFWIEPIRNNFLSIGKIGIPRMVSTILDPINLGHILVFSFVLVWKEAKEVINIRIRKLLMILIFIGLLLTFSKGSLLHLFLFLFLFIRMNIILKIALFVILFSISLFFAMYHQGFIVHLHGFIGILSHLSALGSGLGTFGNYSKMFSESGPQGVGDSYWAAVIGQFGIIGFLVWIFSFLFLCSKINQNSYLGGLIITQIIVCSLSENSFNYMSVFPVMIFFGAKLKTMNLTRSQSLS